MGYGKSQKIRWAKKKDPPFPPRISGTRRTSMYIQSPAKLASALLNALLESFLPGAKAFHAELMQIWLSVITRVRHLRSISDSNSIFPYSPRLTGSPYCMIFIPYRGLFALRG